MSVLIVGKIDLAILIFFKDKQLYLQRLIMTQDVGLEKDGLLLAEWIPRLLLGWTERFQLTSKIVVQMISFPELFIK